VSFSWYRIKNSEYESGSDLVDETAVGCSGCIGQRDVVSAPDSLFDTFSNNGIRQIDGGVGFEFAVYGEMDW